MCVPEGFAGPHVLHYPGRLPLYREATAGVTCGQGHVGGDLSLENTLTYTPSSGLYFVIRVAI